MQQLIELPAVFEVAMQIALFSFLGFLLYEKVLSNTAGKRVTSTASIRKFARIYLASTFLLFSAYLLAYLRGVPWVAMTFGASTLRGLEGVTGFLGFTTLVWPLYPLFRLLGGKESISKASLPNLDQIMYGGIIALAYGALFYGVQSQEQNLSAHLVQFSLVVGIIGIVGTVWLANKKKRERLGQIFLALTLSPWILIVVVAVLHDWRWI
jgi:hypothetical protein